MTCIWCCHGLSLLIDWVKAFIVLLSWVNSVDTGCFLHWACLKFEVLLYFLREAQCKKHWVSSIVTGKLCCQLDCHGSALLIDWGKRWSGVSEHQMFASSHHYITELLHYY